MKNTHLNHYCECTPFTVATTLTPSYMLGSHIQKGLYNGFDDSNSILTHDLYDSPDNTEVDPFSDVRSNKFDLYKLSKQASKDDKSSLILLTGRLGKEISPVKYVSSIIYIEHLRFKC